jgi:hypothetical protein
MPDQSGEKPIKLSLVRMDARMYEFCWHAYLPTLHKPALRQMEDLTFAIAA